MIFEQGHDKLGGRKKGAKNKITNSIREVFEQVFVKSGGVDSFIDWVKRSDANRLEFYKMYSKLIPLDVNLPQGINITINANKKALEAERVSDPRVSDPRVKDPRIKDPQVSLTLKLTVGNKLMAEMNKYAKALKLSFHCFRSKASS